MRVFIIVPIGLLANSWEGHDPIVGGLQRQCSIFIPVVEALQVSSVKVGKA